jgi:hypothetical protein
MNATYHYWAAEANETLNLRSWDWQMTSSLKLWGRKLETLTANEKSNLNNLGCCFHSRRSQACGGPATALYRSNYAGIRICP